MIHERLARTWRRLRQSTKRREFEQELDEELAFHLAMKQAAAGDGPRHGVEREMGNLMQAKENSREAWMFARIEAVVKDVRYALRVLRRSPVFTTCAVLTLALGIGANASIFTLINALLLRGLPVPEPERVVQFSMNGDASMTSFGYPFLQDIQSRTRSYAGIFTWNSTQFSIGWGADSRQVSGAVASGAAYQTLGLQPLAGRLMIPDDDRDGAPLVAVISDAFWSREYHRDAEAVGRTVLLNRHPFTIIGVTPASFYSVTAGDNPSITIPIHANAILHPTFEILTSKSNWYLTIMARLRPGVSMEQARAELAVISPAVMRDQVEPYEIRENAGKQVVAKTLGLIPGATGSSWLAQRYKRALLVLMGISGLVLLVACVNLASLSLARAEARQKELSVRLSLGAGRARLARQLLTESVILSTGGAMLGAFFAFWATSALVAFLSTNGSPLVLNLNPDWRVLSFMAVLAISTGILFGAAPALQGTRMQLNDVLKQSRIGASKGSHRFRLGKALVSAQVGLSVLLLSGALLFVRTLQNLKEQSGFARANVIFMELDAENSGMKDAQLAGFWDNLLPEVRRVPMVQSASLAAIVPVSGNYTWIQLPLSLWPKLNTGERKMYMQRVAADYFQTVGLTLLRGRDFRADDFTSKLNPVILSSYAAQTYFPNRDALGQALRVDEKTNYQVIGVVADAAYQDLRERSPRLAYKVEAGPTFTNLVLRASMDKGAAASLVRSLLRKTGKDVVLGQSISLTEQIDQTLVTERLIALLATFFATLAAMLVAIGIYGVVGYTASRRTNEIGVRLALGATRPDVLWLVMREAILLAAIGMLIGIPAALAAGRIVGSMLYGVESSDPGTMLLTGFLLLFVAAIAGFLPARVASRLDPMLALRYE